MKSKVKKIRANINLHFLLLLILQKKYLIQNFCKVKKTGRACEVTLGVAVIAMCEGVLACGRASLWACQLVGVLACGCASLWVC
jgi:hypothetical protein